MNNPLIPEILTILRDRENGISEYDLMQVFAEHKVYAALAEEAQLALFQKHFITMNALYELQHQLWQDEQIFLEVSPLNVQLLAPNKNSHQAELAISETEKLSTYYRDWDNFENTNETDVIDLLDSFWKKFISLDERVAAYEVLELAPDAVQQEIVENYRRLASKHHPDKGGDKEVFIQVRQAYEILCL